jgi:hypothetical protein
MVTEPEEQAVEEIGPDGNVVEEVDEGGELEQQPP